MQHSYCRYLRGIRQTPARNQTITALEQKNLA
jgi:hypothetical protein